MNLDDQLKLAQLRWPDARKDGSNFDEYKDNSPYGVYVGRTQFNPYDSDFTQWLQEEYGIGVQQYNNIRGNENKWQATPYRGGMQAGMAKHIIYGFGATVPEAICACALIILEAGK